MNELKKKFESIFNNITVNVVEDNRIVVNIKKDEVLTFLSYLKNLGYEHLSLVSCVDWINKSEFELIYILSSYMAKDEEYQEKEKTKIIVKTRIPRKEARFITVINVFENAEPYERELHEMFGIYFEGHPRLTPLLLERDYEIPPFRKDFDMQNYVDNTYGKIPSIKERKKEQNERT
ncbi:MAG: NADH-quinone oxidoreductase subunit C [Candidatus Marinimicrobia bacterium]|nr:NADH-quinone oxidoreductase subunit C [Candidatus Neomarinimicrobiota bacterium]